MNIEQLTFLAGAAQAVQARDTKELRIKGETLVALADLIEAETTKQEEGNGDAS